MAFQISLCRVPDCANKGRLICLEVQGLRASPDLYRYTVGICLESQ